MRLSTSTNIYSHDRGINYAVDMKDSIRLCANAGYHYIDANLCGQCEKNMPMAQDNWESWIHEIKALADCLGVIFTQAHAPFATFEKAIVRSDGTRLEEERFEELMRRCVLSAEILGVEWMVVHPFTVSDASGYSPKKSAIYNQNYYGRWGDIFARHQIGMAIENMSGNWYFYQYGTTAEELLDLIRAIDHQKVKICVDTGHAHLADRNVAGMLRMIGKDLRATHIDDNHGGKIDEHLAPFCGTIDWATVMAAFGELNYQFDFSFEIHHLAHLYPKEVQGGMISFSYVLGKYLMSMSGIDE